MLRFLNALMHAFHVAFIVFYLVAWAVPPLRTAHLVLTVVTLVSWFAIGLVIGKPGFCLATEIQYRIRNRLGLQSERESYIVYLVERLTGRTVRRRVANAVTQGVFYALAATGAALRCLAE